MIVSHDSFLRRIPVSLNITERIRFGTLVFACDIVDDAFQQLQIKTAKYGAEIVKVPAWERASLIAHCWTIVDQVHLIRQIIKRAVPPGLKVLHDFRERHDSARLLRNTMDHVEGNIGNLAEAKEVRPPILGALSYAICKMDAVEKVGERLQLRHYWLVSVPGGPRVKTQYSKVPEIRNSGAITHPTFRFQLLGYAKGQEVVLSIDDVVRDLSEGMKALGDEMETDIRSKIEVAAKEKSVPLDEAFLSGVDNDPLLLSVEFRDSPPG